MAVKKQILIIDDDKTLSRMVAMIFQKAGFEVHAAVNGREGLIKAEKLKPDLIILDVMMPDMSGLDVCKRLRNSSNTAMLPIIMLSARGNVDDKVTGFQAGADDYVQKPVAPKELLARAYALLQRSQRVQSPKVKTIAIAGVKGGVGVTTIAVNVAAALNNQGEKVMLVELRPHHGTAALNLKLTPIQDLGNLLEMSPGQISRSEVSRRVVRHPSGVRLLSAPQQATDHLLTAAHVEAIIEPLLHEVSYLLLDIPYITGEAMSKALGYADEILLVMEPDALSVACARTDLQTLRAWGLVDRTSLISVIRARSNTLIKPSELEQQLGRRVVAAVPPASEILAVSASSGNPAVIAWPEELVSTALLKIASLVKAIK